jgi:hypothetical protein
MPPHATLEYMFFIGASFLVLHHIREHDWRQPFMGLPNYTYRSTAHSAPENLVSIPLRAFWEKNGRLSRKVRGDFKQI